MPFSASYDRATKIISACVCLGLLAIIAATHMLVVAVPLVLIILAAYAYSPRSYVFADRSIVVRRLAGRVRIPLNDLREVRRGTPDDSRGCIRLWGSGGFFGYYGLFRSAKLGKFTAYVTNRNNRVVVIAGSKTALFSPDDVEGFLAAIRDVPSVPASDAPRRSRGFGTITGIALVVAAMGLGVAANLYAPGPPSYTLTPQDPEWRPTARTNGFAGAVRAAWATRAR
jgi:hypothetical protein